MPRMREKYEYGRDMSHMKYTTYQHHIDAAKFALASGGHGMDAVTHALIALALIQREALEEGKWGGHGGS